ncbi:hypothetical protein MASRES_GEN12937_16125 [Acinetobacter baumannii]
MSPRLVVLIKDGVEIITRALSAFGSVIEKVAGESRVISCPTEVEDSTVSKPSPKDGWSWVPLSMAQVTFWKLYSPAAFTKGVSLRKIDLGLSSTKPPICPSPSKSIKDRNDFDSRSSSDSLPPLPPPPPPAPAMTLGALCTSLIA